MNRPLYTQVDEEDSEAQISSRNNIFNKSFVTDLWMRVITKAIEDVALYSLMRQKGKILKEEEIENEESAISFLFNEDHRIPLSDYLVDVYCHKCKETWTTLISKITGQDSICQNCNETIHKKYIEYTITENQEMKEISLAELISLWGIENIKAFRIGAKQRIENIIKEKLNKLEKEN